MRKAEAERLIPRRFPSRKTQRFCPPSNWTEVYTTQLSQAAQR